MAKHKSRKLHVERLEDRNLLSMFGTPWPDARHLSLSFVPDGTNVNGRPSDLFREMNARFETGDWQGEILRAFQTWAQNANISIHMVNDGGQVIGSSGPIQGDPRFGDIRVAARPLSPDVLAITTPPNYFSDTRPGDVILNSQYDMAMNGQSGWDLYSIMLQEAGHALGIGNSSDPQSPMYEVYSAGHNKLTPQDIVALRSLYGAPQQDHYEGEAGNESFKHASRLGFASGSASAFADLTTKSDVDFYKVRTAAGVNKLTVRLQTTGVSLLTARVNVYDNTGKSIAYNHSRDPLKGDIAIRLDHLKSDSTYYIRVTGEANSEFSIGSYSLRIQQGWDTSAGSTTPTQSRVVDDNHTDDTLRRSTDLDKRQFRDDPRYDYIVQGRIRDAADVDFYGVRAPQDKSNVMLVTLWGTDEQPVAPKISVFDKNGNLLNVQVLVHTADSIAIQLSNVVPGGKYYIKVGDARLGTSQPVNYTMSVDFREHAVELDTLVQSTLGGSTVQEFYSLNVSQSQVFHLVLAESSQDAAVATAVRVSIYDEAHHLIFSMTVHNGDTRTSDVFLPAGAYSLRFEGGDGNGGDLSALSFTLGNVRLTDPIDPQPSDPTNDPANPAPPPDDPPYDVPPDPEPTTDPVSTLDPYSDPFADSSTPVYNDPLAWNDTFVDLGV